MLLIPVFFEDRVHVVTWLSVVSESLLLVEYFLLFFSLSIG